jgi:hypothetical protein
MRHFALTATQMNEAIHAWDLGGSMGLGLVRAKLKCEYGPLLYAVLAELKRRGLPSGLEEQEEQPVPATCPGCQQVAELHPDWFICDACLVDRVNGAGELELDDPDDELYEHFKRCLKRRAAKAEPRKGEQLIPAGARHGQCRSCQADVIWISTANGRPMPLSIATIEERDGQRFALPHFVNCPQGKGWSKR